MELKLPCILDKHQIHRPNINTLSVGEYFRVSVYNILYDHVLDDLNDRFLKYVVIEKQIQSKTENDLHMSENILC